MLKLDKLMGKGEGAGPPPLSIFENLNNTLSSNLWFGKGHFSVIDQRIPYWFLSIDPNEDCETTKRDVITKM